MARSLEMMNDELGCKFYFVSTRMTSVWPWTYLQVDTWLLLARSSKSKRFVCTSLYIGVVFCSFDACKLDACSSTHASRHGVDSVQKEKPRASSYRICICMLHTIYNSSMVCMLHTIYNSSIDLLKMSLDSAPKVLFRYLMDQSGAVVDVDEERVECEASFRWAMTRSGTCKRDSASAPSDAAGMHAGRMRTRKQGMLTCTVIPARACVCARTQQVRQIHWSPARWWPRC
jgi:hypothetical protein